MKLKEMRYTLNTGTGQSTMTTDAIIGKLNSIVIDSNSRVSVIILSDLGYTIFKRAEVYGTNYFAVRTRSSAPEENLMDVLGFEEFILNEPLNIIVNGPKDVNVTFVIRYE